MDPKGEQGARSKEEGMPKIVIPNTVEALAEKLRVCRMAKSNLEKEERGLKKQLDELIQPYVDDAGFKETTDLVIQDTNLTIQLVPSKGAPKVDQEKMAELVAPEIIEQVISTKPYHQVKIKRG